jgi:hypothetical protein
MVSVKHDFTLVSRLTITGQSTHPALSWRPLDDWYPQTPIELAIFDPQVDLDIP